LGNFRRPEYDIPEIPNHLTEITDMHLMDLFAQYVAWQNFIDQEYVTMEIEETRAQSRKDVATARAMVSSDQKQVTLQKAESAIEVDAFTSDWVTTKANRKAVGIQKDALERLANLVSRELSRRIGRGPTQRRSDRFQP
jgi:hypothetical protein